MSIYMLDTHICSYIIKERPISALKNFEKYSEETICISVITYAELVYGVERATSKRVNRSIIEDFVHRLIVYPWNQSAAENYAFIRNQLEKQGKPIGNMDTLIAAHAKALKAILVTNDSKHFKQIKNLKIKNWI